jgi:hypothetical protein
MWLFVMAVLANQYKGSFQKLPVMVNFMCQLCLGMVCPKSCSEIISGYVDEGVSRRQKHLYGWT